MGGSIAHWLAYLFPDPAAPGLNPDSGVFSYVALPIQWTVKPLIQVIEPNEVVASYYCKRGQVN